MLGQLHYFSSTVAQTPFLTIQGFRSAPTPQNIFRFQQSLRHVCLVIHDVFELRMPRKRRIKSARDNSRPASRSLKHPTAFSKCVKAIIIYITKLLIIRPVQLHFPTPLYCRTPDTFRPEVLILSAPVPCSLRMASGDNRSSTRGSNLLSNALAHKSKKSFRFSKLTLCH